MTDMAIRVLLALGGVMAGMRLVDDVRAARAHLRSRRNPE